MQILKTKLYRPRLPGDYVPRPRLLEALEKGRSRPLALISAPAGYGKTTLVSHWLETSGAATAWLSLDESDSDPEAFLAYFIAALRTVSPKVCPRTLALLKSKELPPPTTLAESLLREMDAIKERVVIVLDDYQRIGNQDVHEILVYLLKHPHRALHLVLLTRRDPPLPVGLLLARSMVTEFRVQDLTFSQAETAAFLKLALDRTLGDRTCSRLHERTEGWPVALRLAVLALQHREDPDGFVEGFGSGSRHIREFLVSEVLSGLPPRVGNCLCKTAILDRFCAPLCEAICISLGNPGEGIGVMKPEGRCAGLTAHEFLDLLQGTGLFCIALDDRQQWFRYHHLFQELLQHQLRSRYGPSEISALHGRAAAWFEEQGLIEEALQHTLRASDPAEAGAMIVRQRHEVTSREQWHRLNRWLNLLPLETVENNLDLLTMKAWSSIYRGRVAEVAPLVDLVEKLLDQATGRTVVAERLRGEIDALRGFLFYMAADGVQALPLCRRALERLPPEFLAERASTTIILATSLHMNGDVQEAFRVVYDALGSGARLGGSYRGRLLLTLCFIQWMEADLGELQKTGSTMLKVGTDLDLPDTTAYAHYYQGCVHYHHNRLKEAVDAVDSVVTAPSGPTLVVSMESLPLLVLALHELGEAVKARTLVEDAIGKLLEEGSTHYLPAVRALEAELALRQGRLSEAFRWAAGVDTGNPGAAYTFLVPEVTAAKVFLRKGTGPALERAEGLLDQLRQFFESTHNARFLIEVLALQALLHHARGEEASAAESLGRALSLARPGGFIRLFVDLGPELATLLNRLDLDEEALQHAGRILGAFRAAGGNGEEDIPARPDPLSSRELEVLGLLTSRLSSKEIAGKLFISPRTVQRHTENIYSKLGVHRRPEAVAKARGLGILKN